MQAHLVCWRDGPPGTRGPFLVQPGQDGAADPQHAVWATFLTEVCYFIFVLLFIFFSVHRKFMVLTSKPSLE